jgi:hypothetical protein
MIVLTGKISWFGGPGDSGVGITETLALYPDIRARWLGTKLYCTDYCAMRWNYAEIATATGKSRAAVTGLIRSTRIMVQAHNRQSAPWLMLRPADWGPAKWTGRIIDVSSASMSYLEVQTDELVDVTMPNWLITEPI